MGSLLALPAFSQLERGIDPVHRHFVSRPPNSERSRSKGALFTDHLPQVDEDTGFSLRYICKLVTRNRVGTIDLQYRKTLANVYVINLTYCGILPKRQTTQ